MAISVALPLIFCQSAPRHRPRHAHHSIPKMYSEAPQVLVVMPPTNASAESGADNAVYGTIFRCLTEKGYTVIPTPMSSDYFRSVGKTASDYQGSLDEIREKFGADACVFTEIQSLEWGLKTLSSKVRMYIRSAKTGPVFRHFGTQIKKVQPFCRPFWGGSPNRTVPTIPRPCLG